MSNRTTSYLTRYQSGAVTILVTTILMMLVTGAALTVGRIGANQEATSAIDYRTREAKEAAEAGLEYALAWLRENSCSGCTTTFPGDELPNLQSGYSLTPILTFADLPNGYLRVTSTVEAENGAIRSTAQQIVHQLYPYLTPDGANAPPIVVDGCLSDVKGTPDIFPRPDGIAIKTLATDNPGHGFNGDCLELGHFDVRICNSSGDDRSCTPAEGVGSGADVSPACPGASCAYLDGEASSLSEPKAWNYVFNISLSDAKTKATAAGQTYSKKQDVPTGDAPDFPFLMYTGKNPLNGGTTYGSPDHPVVIILTDPGCPKFNGGARVYGFVYYAQTDGDCNGWGGAEIVGTALLEESAKKFNANTGFYSMKNLSGNPPAGTLFAIDDAVRLPGSWKDW
ncbi:MAG: hypothetical protein GVY22_08010 [Gammaproteobacteria bacterium]|nr:hypothetical protein [Gammaproteobacteria bacterium]